MPIKISIITINYQNGLELERTITSVLNQSYKDIEYIIIDGGSTDCSNEIINKYLGTLYYTVSEKDNGIYQAMNKGWRKATGDYCLFLNSGDYLFDKQVISNVVNQIYIKSADVIFGNLYAFDENQSWTSTFTEDISLYFFQHSFIPHPATFTKRDLLEKINGFYENYKIISDWAFFVNAYLIGASFKRIDVTTTSFYMQGSSSNAAIALNDKDVLFKNEFKFLAEDFKNFERLRHFDTSIITKLARKVSILKIKYLG